MKVSEVTSWIEDVAPLSLQESYDNSGLLIGDKSSEVSGALLCIDVTEAVIDEAIQNNCNLIISHHPLIFKGLKKITGQDYIQRCVIKAIKNNIAVYAAHTNIDNVMQGVNGKIADKIGLSNRAILRPKPDSLVKLVTFVPNEYLNLVREKLFEAGAGTIGNYDYCSFNVEGTGTFRPNEKAEPFVGNTGTLHTEQETRVEIIIPKYKVLNVVSALYKVHPYEEPAFDLLPLLNDWNITGAGMIGELEQAISETDLLNLIKKTFKVDMLRHTDLTGKKISKIAVCGGAGSEFLHNAIAQKADVYISGDFKYHEFFHTEGQIMIIDIGHYESEQFTKEVFYEIITKKIPNFAPRISNVKTNPINYF